MKYLKLFENVENIYSQLIQLSDMHENIIKKIASKYTKYKSDVSYVVAINDQYEWCLGEDKNDIIESMREEGITNINELDIAFDVDFYFDFPDNTGQKYFDYYNGVLKDMNNIFNMYKNSYEILAMNFDKKTNRKTYFTISLLYDIEKGRYNTINLMKKINI
jgi:hypothetical protein